MLDDAILDARAWMLFTAALLAIVFVVLVILLFLGLLIQFTIREIRRKALEIMRTPPKERIATTWQPKT